MKNKNGFIASSVMFSFFLVFILLCVLVLTSYTQYNKLIRSLNGTILIDLNKEIEKKYLGIKTLVNNGLPDRSVENTQPAWDISNNAYFKEITQSNNYFITVKSHVDNASFKQNLTDSIAENSQEDNVVYVAFDFNYGYQDDCTQCDFNVGFIDGNNDFNRINTLYYLNSNYVSTPIAPKALVNNNSTINNWILYGGIIRTRKKITGVQFEASKLNFDEKNASGIFGINNIVVANITKLYKNNNSSNDEKVIQYLLKELPFIRQGQKYSLPKI